MRMVNKLLLLLSIGNDPACMDLHVGSVVRKYGIFMRLVSKKDTLNHLS